MEIESFFSKHRIDVFAIGDVDTIEAPKGFHPNDILPGSRSIIVFGRSIGDDVFKLDSKVKSFYLYKLINQMDTVSYKLCEFFRMDGFSSIPVPTFFPSRIKGGKIRGLLSLKHFAEAVGLGSIGENTLLISKEYGNRLCLSAIVTQKKFEYKPINNDQDLCLKCNKCVNICPTHAIKNRNVDVTKCKNFTNSVPKFLIPVMLFLMKMEWAEKYIENIVNIMGWNSDMVCSDCLTVCPHFGIDSSYNKTNSAYAKNHAAD